MTNNYEYETPIMVMRNLDQENMPYTQKEINALVKSSSASLGSKLNIAYEKYENIYKGQLKEAFTTGYSLEDKNRFINVNLVKPAVRELSNLFVSSNPSFAVQSDDAQEWLDKYLKDNKLYSNLFDIVVSMLVLGGVVIKTGMRPKDNGEIDIFTEYVHPKHLEVIQNPWDISKPKGYRLTYNVGFDGVEYRRIEEYKDNLYTYYNLERKDGQAEFELVEFEEIKHNAGMLIHYVPFNRDPFSFFGKSIIADVEDLLKEVCNRFTYLKRVLDIFASPKIIVPPSIFAQMQKTMGISVKVDGYGSEYMSVESIMGQHDIYCHNPAIDGENPPEYLTWDANTEAAFNFLFTNISAMALIMGVPEHVLSIKDGSVYPESGKAISLRYIPSLIIVKNIQNLLSDALELSFYSAQKLAYYYGLIAFEAEWVNTTFSNAFPLDAEDVAIEITKQQAGLQSEETTRKKINNTNSRQDAEEVERIKEEKAEKESSHSHDKTPEPFNLTDLLEMNKKEEETKEGEE
ncbi:phage portal protein [Lysinibacillus sp. NPDC098008]|uniref:phage portal protein n=1 Tax=Lysinibacillus sp. NPDC098008 TaxID=3364146 RepID=UPI003821EA0E